MLILLAFLAIIVALLWAPCQRWVRAAVEMHRLAVFAAPVFLTLVFCGAAAYFGAWSLPLGGFVLAYTLAPALCVQAARNRPQAGWSDLAAVLLLWLPIEFAAGTSLIPRRAQGMLHATAYGVAITLGLVLFLAFRRLPGMKYNWPRRRADLRNAAFGYLALVGALVPLGLRLGFLPPAHLVTHAPGVVGSRIVFIFFATALPEEILFRGLVQNILTQILGDTNRTILLAGFIFGCAHLNNGPQPLPNWRYMILATIAGVVLGKVFQKSTSVVASALAHTAVDATKWCFF